MGDVGYRDEHGRLWFCGRKSHRVVTPHGTLFTDPLRASLQHACRLRGTHRAGRGDSGWRDVPVLCVEVGSKLNVPSRDQDSRES